jgi:hypothetical protein
MKIIEEIVIVHVADHIGGGFIGDVRPEKIAVAVNLKRVRIAHGVKLLSVSANIVEQKIEGFIFRHDIRDGVIAGFVFKGALGNDLAIICDRHILAIRLDHSLDGIIEAADGSLDLIKIHGTDIYRGVCDAVVGILMREHIHPLELNKLVLGIRDFTAILGAGVIGKEPGAYGGGQRAGRHG